MSSSSSRKFSRITGICAKLLSRVGSAIDNEDDDANVSLLPMFMVIYLAALVGFDAGAC